MPSDFNLFVDINLMIFRALKNIKINSYQQFFLNIIRVTFNFGMCVFYHYLSIYAKGQIVIKSLITCSSSISFECGL